MSYRTQEEDREKDHRERVRNLCDRCRRLFNGEDRWMCICHPALNYKSPLTWIRDGLSISTVEELLTKEEAELGGNQNGNSTSN